jgi:hypothetical protein
MKRMFILLVIMMFVPLSAIASQFTVNGDGTVTDSSSGLMWQQEDDNVFRTWEEAIAYCENLVLPPSKYSDWRLPNIRELRTIVAKGKYNPSIDTTAFPNTNSSGYWSSREGSATLAWYVTFYEGAETNDFKTREFYVRCVRGGK